jgi:hypothetical protein
LLDALRDKSGSVRFAALEGLVKVADRTAIEPLKHFLGDKRLQPGGRRIASELLYKLEKGSRSRSSGQTKRRTSWQHVALGSVSHTYPLAEKHRGRMMVRVESPAGGR